MISKVTIIVSAVTAIISVSVGYYIPKQTDYCEVLYREESDAKIKRDEMVRKDIENARKRIGAATPETSPSSFH